MIILTMRHKIKKVLNHHLFRKSALVIIIGAVFLMSSFLLWISTFKMPDLGDFSERKVAQSTKIYDRNGILLYDLFSDIKRSVVPYTEISRNLKNATVAIEDAEFYQHPGIKISSIFRAVFANILGGGFNQGGSTITQQVIKNSLLTTEKTISRKLKEWVLALKLEKMYDKETILAMYLNEAPYGGSIYGIEEASEEYFNKKASDLSITESAYLASIPNAPTRYSPYGNNKDRLEARKNLVLLRMLQNNFISQEEYDKSLAEKIAFEPQEEIGIKAPHFVMFIKQYLVDKYGEQALSEKGLRVTTTLDYSLEKKIEDKVKIYALENKQKFNAENASVVVIDPKTGQILAMVGSRDYFDKEIQGNFNVAIAHRQPGSAFKPFAYAEAFLKGYTPDTVVFDVPTEFSSLCNPDGTPILPGNADKCYMPDNYDLKFVGPISFRDAIAQSRNVPSIKVFYLAGMKDTLQLAKDMGIQSLTNINQYGLTLVLGGGEVSPLDMTSAYSVFANSGERNPYTGILKIEDENGNLIESYQKNSSKVLPENVAYMVSNVLSDNNARIPIYGVDSPLNFPNRDVAVKTGTTNDYKDAWIIGYTPQVVVGAWAGNNDNTPMEKKVSGYIVAPMWRAVVNDILANLPVENFPKPEMPDPKTLKPVIKGEWRGGVQYYIDKFSGKRATDLTPPEAIQEKVIQNIHSILYWVNKDNPLGPPPLNPADDSQFNLWEYGVRKWATENGFADQDQSIIPTAFDDLHTADSKPKISILNPVSGNTYQKGAIMTATVIGIGKYPLTKVDFYLNGSYIGATQTSPFNFSFIPKEIDGLQVQNEFKAVGYDTILNKGESIVKFDISDF
jgi:1A family penicillin-binding protein